MSELSALTRLAEFRGKSSLDASDPAIRRRALKGLALQLGGQGPKRSVGEMLAIVLALSARTRRAARPAVSIDLDVFAPAGCRAVRLRCGPTTR